MMGAAKNSTERRKVRSLINVNSFLARDFEFRDRTDLYLDCLILPNDSHPYLILSTAILAGSYKVLNVEVLLSLSGPDRVH